MLQPYLSKRDTCARHADDYKQSAVRPGAGATRSMQRTDQKYNHQGDVSDALQDTQRTRILVFVILQIQRIRKQSAAYDEARKRAEPRCSLQSHATCSISNVNEESAGRRVDRFERRSARPLPVKLRRRRNPSPSVPRSLTAGCITAVSRLTYFSFLCFSTIDSKCKSTDAVTGELARIQYKVKSP
jgi:hypothetical protein